MKKVLGIVCALALAMVLPLGAAFAVSSSEVQTVTATGANGTTLTVTGTYAQLHQDSVVGLCDLNVTSTSTYASNTPAGANVIASYEVYYAKPDGSSSVHDDHHGWIHTGGSLSFALGTGNKYANYYFTCYIQHNSGATEVVNGVTDSNGVATVSATELSFYTFVIGDKVSTSTDTSSTSPATGVDLTGVAGGVVACIAVGGCAAFALRRKMAK